MHSGRSLQCTSSHQSHHAGYWANARPTSFQVTPLRKHTPKGTDRSARGSSGGSWDTSTARHRAPGSMPRRQSGPAAPPCRGRRVLIAPLCCSPAAAVVPQVYRTRPRQRRALEQRHPRKAAVPQPSACGDGCIAARIQGTRVALMVEHHCLHRQASPQVPRE